MRRPLLVLFILVTISQWSSSAEAQLVVVRPGYVKAPFVRVVRQANGRTYVRAPFVRVNSTSGRRTVARGISPVQKAAEPLVDLDWDGLRQTIAATRRQLDQELSSFPTGGVWRSYFQTREAYLQPGQKGRPGDQERTQVAAVLDIFEKAVGNRDLTAITKKPSYLQLQAALREFISLPVERLRRSLAISAAQLQQQLTRVRPSRRWQTYLAVPPSVLGSANEASAAINVDDLLKTADRYQAVVSDPKDAAIRALPAFQQTRQRLKALIDFVSGPPTPPAEGEEVPPPTRNR